MALMGIDVGTTACKVVAFQEDGSVCASARKEYKVYHPREGWAEFLPGEIWRAVTSSVALVVNQCSQKIDALAISSQGEGVVPLDESLEPVGPVIVSYDLRSVEQTERLRKQFREEYFFARGGQILASMGTVTKIMWMKEHPEYFAKPPSRYVCVGDYVLLKLTGQMVTDYSLAARTMMEDIHNRCWNQELLEYVQVKEKSLCRLEQAGTVIGTIQPGAAEETGLPLTTAVAVGGHDQPCAMLGTGANRLGEAAYSLGTTETLVCSMKDFQKDLFSLGLPCYPHVLEGRYITLPGNFTGGNLMQWYKNTFAQWENHMAEGKNRSVYELLMEEMEEVPSGLLVLPHFTVTGSPWNDSGSCGLVAGLSLTTTKGQYIRGLQEGVTYEILLNLVLLQRTGIRLDVLYAVGGGTNSPKLMQLKADVLGIPLYIPAIYEAPCRGAALLAGKGIGLFPNAEEAWQTPKDISRIVYPDMEKHKRYEELFVHYQRLYPAVKTILK